MKTGIGRRLLDIGWRLNGFMLVTVLVCALVVSGFSWSTLFAATIVVLFFGVELSVGE